MYILHTLHKNTRTHIYISITHVRTHIHTRASLVAQAVKSACNAGDPGSIPGSGRPPGEGNGYPLQYSCLGNSMDREA